MTSPVEIRYVNASYNFDNYAEKGVLLSKKDDPDAVYAYKQWTHYSGGSGSTEYAVIRLESRNGHYFEDEDFEDSELEEEVLDELPSEDCEEPPFSGASGRMMLP